MTAEEIKKVNSLVPIKGKIIKINQETSDTKTYTITDENGKKPFTPMPGQLGMLSIPNVGEAMFSITNQGENSIDMAIKSVGTLTNALFDVEEGQECGIRGPYGNGFPLEKCKGRDILFIAGGIGLAPVRSLIMHCIKNRADYGKLTVIYGARSYSDLVFKEDILENWAKVDNMDVFVTIDRGEECWKQHVGFVPSYVEELNLPPTLTFVCGPPIMIKFTLQSLMKMCYNEDEVITTMEMRMKCGIGKCGRCNIGSCFVCLDGPVFTMREMNALPQEY